MCNGEISFKQHMRNNEMNTTLLLIECLSNNCDPMWILGQTMRQKYVISNIYAEDTLLQKTM